MSSSHFPIELVGIILERAVRTTIDTDPKFAVSLQLISPTTRKWLLPVLYNVFVVKWPEDGRMDTPSLVFLLRLCTDQPTHCIRPYIHHIVFVLQVEQEDIEPLELPSGFVPREWQLESVAGDEFDFLKVIIQLELRPRRIFIHENGGCGAIMFGALVQQRTRDDTLQHAFKAICGRLEEVETACVVHLTEGMNGPTSRASAEDAYLELTRMADKLEVQPNRAIHLRIVVDIPSHDSVTMAVCLIVSALRCPGISITLVLPLIVGVRHDHDVPSTAQNADASTTRALCEALSTTEELSVGSMLRQKLKVSFAPECKRPKSSVAYARMVRAGIRDVSSHCLDDIWAPTRET